MTKAVLADLEIDSEIVVAEDGSNDGTRELAIELASTDSQIHLLSSEERLGRGKALNRAIKACSWDVICYIDADLATDMAYLPELIEAVANEGYDIAIGSRLMGNSQAKRDIRRLLASMAYNRMVRFILGSKVCDHQCGFKAFKKDKIISIIDEIKDNHWFWDTELIVRGQRLGYKIKEIPVTWTESKFTKVSITKDANSMGRQIIRLWWELRDNGN